MAVKPRARAAKSLNSTAVLPPEPSMEAAFKRALDSFGRGATVGVNRCKPDTPYFVGVTIAFGRWSKRGEGKSFDEAFAAVRDWPEGPPPKREIQDEVKQASECSERQARKEAGTHGASWSAKQVRTERPRR